MAARKDRGSKLRGCGFLANLLLFEKYQFR